MSDKDCGTCNEHSGIEGRSRLLVWLLAVLITISASQAALLLSLKTEVAGFAYRFASNEQGNREIKDELKDMNRRLTRLEMGDAWMARASKGP